MTLYLNHIQSQTHRRRSGGLAPRLLSPVNKPVRRI
jgi:hypothetical protein